MSDFDDDLGLVGSSNISWNSVEGAPRATHESGHVSVSEGVRKLAELDRHRIEKNLELHKIASDWLAAHCGPVALIPALAQLLADALLEERRREARAIRGVVQKAFMAQPEAGPTPERVTLSWVLARCNERLRALAAREGAGK